MSFWSMLGTFFISPLKLVFECIFQAVYEIIANPGVCIIFLSLAMNFLVLPLYKRADAMQEQARDTEARLAPGVKHIKKTFSGNERMMMLQTYYRQNNYSPANALHGSVSLLLEIPFFMAAYQFLSHLELLKGVSFGPITDLGAPDAMISIGALTVNLLPILMTLINFISSAIYLRGFPLKTKIQIYGIAIVFLVFLYTSPAGLVFYWTLNNVFSLVKNIVLKLLKPWMDRSERSKKRADKAALKNAAAKPDRRLFIAAALFLTLFIGLLIPTTFISASPQEYVDLNYYFSPLWYAVSSFILAAGFFIFWFGVFYWLASPRGKVVFERVMLIFCALSIANYMFFGRKLGVVSNVLKYEGGVFFSPSERIINGVVFFALIALMILAAKKLKSAPRMVLAVAAAAVAVMSCINIFTAAKSLKDIGSSKTETGPHFTLSKEGQNVVVMFLDRAMGNYIPYLVNEKPELKEIFDGFTYYSNTISFGGHTNMGAPALMGGYEYTPVELNRRDTESLKDKHNESLKVMPVLFDSKGFDVTVFDAPYANYKWIPDMSIYDEWPRISTHITKGYFGSTEDKQQVIDNNMRNFFVFSLMKCLPLELQPPFYDGGNYLIAGDQNGTAFQINYGMSQARGMSQSFMESYKVLENLGKMTEVKDSGKGSFVFFYTDAPHETMIMKEPEYIPAPVVDNSEYDEARKGRFKLGGHSLSITNTEQIAHYQTNMAVLLQIGNWLDSLRKSGVYDNTRIILVSDHGYYLYQDPELLHVRKGKYLDLDNFYPLLMVKDFGAHGFTVSGEFMTNADVPTMAVKDVIKDPVNPFTGKLIDNSEKTAHDQFIMTSHDWGVDSNNGNTFKASGWAVITDDIRDSSDWQFIDDNIVLKEHRIP
ncbi:MAG: YidC/Oxa1 family membrane protein insertase [Firmicutes bacterium]|nr:YidC/Oxa1 family membrane protein insertase [Bacillota bacterium]